MIHKEIEINVDNMVAKSTTREDHFKALEKFLQWVVKYKFSLNLNKCVFEVTSSKLLGNQFSQKGKDEDPDKVKAIVEMPTLYTKKEVWGFLRKLQYIKRFMARLINIC